jgi:cell division protein FtsX
VLLVTIVFVVSGVVKEVNNTTKAVSPNVEINFFII